MRSAFLSANMIGKPKTTIKPRRPGGQPGNRNAWKHGHRSAQAILRRQLCCAHLKIVAHIGLGLQMFFRTALPRPRPLRPDQFALLAIHDPDALGMLEAAGRARVPDERTSAQLKKNLLDYLRTIVGLPGKP